MAAIDHYRRMCDGAASRAGVDAGRDVPPLHDAAVGGGQGRMDEPATADVFARFCEIAAAAHLAT